MDWQNILMIIITVLLLFVWLPVLILSVRRALRKEKPHSEPNSRRHSGPDPESCHSEQSREIIIKQ